MVAKQVATDTGGDAVERYIYDPYGKVTILNGANGVDKDGAVTEWTEDGDQTASDVENSILYCGYRFDNETGLYHVRRRGRSRSCHEQVWSQGSAQWPEATLHRLRSSRHPSYISSS